MSGLNVNEKCDRCIQECKQYTLHSVIITNCPDGNKYKKKK